MSSFSTDPNKAPESDELEVSLFGPGIGECVVLHLGNGIWAVVDSCCDPSGEPIALTYLQSLGIDPAAAVKFIIISHWHDDHVKGMAKLVRTCVNATIIYSAALLKREFLTLVDAMNEPTSQIDRGQSGLNEMAGVVRELHRRGQKVQQHLSPATANKRVYLADDVELWCLSPSDLDCTNALSEFGSLTESLTKDYQGVVPAPTSNRNAVALWVIFGENDVLLGADLENSPHPSSGWEAIVTSQGRPNRKASVFKVPHHGSETGHNEAVISELLHPNPISILTAYNRGRSPLPKPADIARIQSYSSAVFATTLPTAKKVKRDLTVEKEMKTVVTRRTVLNGTVGHVRVRLQKQLNAEAVVDGPLIVS